MFFRFNMCTHPISVRLPPNPYEYSQGVRGDKVVQVPCGKCPECLSKRQNDIAVRAYREALKYGNCWFLTLTYAPDYVPFAKTLLSVNKDTSEILIDKCSELCNKYECDFLRQEYHNAGPGLFCRFVDLVDIEDTLFQVVYTPTLYYTDVRLMIKNFRVKYEREFKQKLDFKYISVGEYGHKNSIRPHYHLLFFGLTRFQIDYLRNMWSKGRHYLKAVKFKNDDGSDGIAKVASYIGKYAAKGSFVPDSVRSHYTLPCRVSSSRGLGLDDLDRLIDYYRCYDLVGKYDIEKLDFDYDIQKFYDVLFSRLTYEFDGYKISLPISLRRKIFGFKVVDGKACWSRLYYQVMAYERDKFSDLRDREFRQFCASHFDSTLAENVSAFNNLQEATLLSREKTQRERLAKFYSKSKF